MYPGAPAPSTRPTTVSTSAYLVYAAAGISLAGSLLTLVFVSRILGAYRSALADTGAQGIESVVVFVLVGALVINLLFAAGLVILAIFNSRGRQGARVTSWVVGGLLVCCSGLGLVGNAANGMVGSTSGTAGGPSEREIQDRLAQALPNWYQPLSTTLSVLMLLTLLAALILLALPASNAYFRAVKAARQGGWDPSVPYPVYPVYPGAPAYPAEQYPGQPYPGQPQPGQPQPGQPYPGQPQPGQPQPGQPRASDPWGRPTGEDPEPPRDPTAQP
jgi:hypothetical protein